MSEAIVVDIGSGAIKCGFSGKFSVSSIFRSFVGQNKDVQEFYEETQKFAGKLAFGRKGMLKLTYPISNSGLVENWNDYELLLSTIFESELGVSPVDKNVLVIFPPFTPVVNRVRTARFLFESCHVSGLFITNTALMSLYANGSTTGIVLDCGEGCCTSTPVIDNKILENSVERIDIGGRNVTNRLNRLLRLGGYVFHTSSELETVRDIKEKICYVSSEPYVEGKSISVSEAQYTLPDKKVITLTEERYLAPEILFNPTLIGSEYNSVDKMLHTSIESCNIDVRERLCSSIVVSGGGSLFKGFPERLIFQVRSRIKNADFPLKLIAPKTRMNSAWVGGSVLASQEIVSNMWITKDKYQAEGTRCIPKGI